MELKKPLLQLPVPSTEFEGSTNLCNGGIRSQYRRSGILYRSGIEFTRIAATRTWAERCCTAWHIETAYDTLVQIENSDWVEEVRANTSEQWRNEWQMHHYMIYLD